MEKTVIFDNNTVEQYFMSLMHHFDWSEHNFEDKDIQRNICCTMGFEGLIKELRIYGADTEVGNYDDNGYLRIGFARINGHEVVKNAKINLKELKDSLWEIAHPDKEATV